MCKEVREGEGGLFLRAPLMREGGFAPGDCGGGAATWLAAVNASLRPAGMHFIPPPCACSGAPDD